MQFTFIDMKGKTLFLRDDAERAQWTREEFTLDLEFPYLSDKVITIGQRIFFKDPATGNHQIYEVKQAQTYEPDAYQQVVAEHICISELSDEHINEQEITGKSCSDALGVILDGTLWSVGDKKYNPTSSADITRGSVWQAILQIKDNWNVYITPNVTLNADGTITRKLTISNTAGTWNGLRLSVDKNMIDPSVTYDDSELYTALYGYGGNIATGSTTEKDKQCDFSEVVWEKTSDHPAKPAGQKYLEDPAATTEYGRNGRARFGYYQNNSITDPDILLLKTWETLKTVSTPDISIEGTVADLYRLGYADQPLKLHDVALVEVLPAGFKKEIQIIRMTVDLLDPTATTVTIGSYIPNIIYINRETNEDATGSRGGGGKNTSKDNSWHEFRTTIDQFENGTGMRFQSVQNDINNTNEEVAVQTARIDLTFSMIRQEVEDRRDADNVLNSTITQTASAIRAEVSAQNSQVYSTIEVTSSQIRSEVSSTASGLYTSVITQTDSMIKSEVASATSEVYTSVITQTDSYIKSEVATNNSTVYSVIEQTATQIRSEVANTASGVYSSVITQTSSMIKTEVSNNNSSVYSTIEQTATQIRSEVASTASGVYSSAITQTSNMIKSEVSNNNSTVYSTIDQTASQIRSEVSSTASGVYTSAITQTSSMISSEVSTNNSKVYSAIKQQSNRIDIVVSGSGSNAKVNTASIVLGINDQSGSYVKISADTINLSGYVTASQLSAVQASVDNLSAGVTKASLLYAGVVQADTLKAGGIAAAWLSKTINGVTFYYLGHS